MRHDTLTLTERVEQLSRLARRQPLRPPTTTGTLELRLFSPVPPAGEPIE